MRTSVLGTIIVSVLLLGSAGRLTAQTVGCDMQSEDYTEEILNANRIRAKILNTGTLFWNGGANVYAVGENNALFNAGLAIAGLVDGELRVAASTYGPYEFWPGPVDSVRAGVDCRRLNRMYRISRRDLNELDDGLPPTDDMRDWPWRLGAPVEDGDGDPNNYDLAAGDRPKLLGGEMIHWIMNDVAGPHGYTESEPLGLEVHATAFSAPSNDTDIHYATFYRYRIINKSDARIDSAYIGMLVDHDLGAAFDDYVGSDSLLHLVYGYNADNDDDGNFGTAPPAVGFRIFESPVGLPDGYDNDHDGAVDESGERLGLSYAAYYNSGGGVQGDPSGAEGVYNYLRGRWEDGQPMTRGGDGRDHSSDPVRFAYPADPGEFWSESNVDGFDKQNAPADRRLVPSSGPFRLEPGEETELFFGILYARGADNLDSVRELKAAAKKLEGLRPRDVTGERIDLRGGHVRALTPGDGATDVPLDAPFVWTGGVPDARYELELIAVETGERTLIEYDWTDDLDARLDLEPSTSYRWRVREFTVDVNGRWTPQHMFTTGFRPYSEYNPFRGFIVPYNADGRLDPPVGASPDWVGFPGERPSDSQQVGAASWFVHTVIESPDQGYADFVRRVVPSNVYRTLLWDYEIRFSGSSRALNNAGQVLGDDVPFELWAVGDDIPYGFDGGVRLIPRIQDEGNDGWGLRLEDHPGSGGPDDPWLDPITFLSPTDRTTGDAGYRAFEEAATTGSDAAQFAGDALLNDIVLVGWNLGVDPGEIQQYVPENGTIIRIVTGEVPPPVLTAPGPGQYISTDPVAFYWMDSVADRSSFELSRSEDFIDLVTIKEDVESGLTLDPLPEGTYYWRIRGSLGLSPTWSFTVVAGVDTDNRPDVPERFEIGTPYPNPARTTLTLPTAGRASGAVMIELFDVLGRRVISAEVATEGRMRLDVSDLSAGVYVLRARADGREWTYPVVIRR